MKYRLITLTPWSRVLLEKLTVTQLVKKFPPSMKPESSLSCSQEPTAGYYPEPDASTSNLPTLFPKIHLDVIHLSTPRSFR
jgi:hypothetical protein